MAEYIGWKPALSAALGKIGETLAVQQVALTSNLIYTIPEGTPSGIVHRVAFTQDGTGGHTVTHGPDTLVIDTTAGASTLVEIWPGGEVVYPGATGSGSLYSSATQVGTLTLPAAPTPGRTVSVLADSATVIPGGVRWDSGGAPVVAVGEQRIVTLIWSGTDWVGTYSLAVGVPAVPTDTTPPAWTATFTLGTPTETSVTATASALATDDTGVTGYQVSYDDGVTNTPIGVTGSTFTLAGSASTTYATTKLRAVDAAGNLSAWLAVPSYTMASPTDTTPPAWTATFTLGTPTPGSIPVTPSALATDDTAVTSYEQTLDSAAGTVVWSNIGLPVGGVLTVTGMTASTTYADVALRAKDAAGNTSAPLSVPSFTTAAPAAPPDLGWFASYYADDLVLTDGAEVLTWEDRSASYDMTGGPAGRRPVYVASDPAFGGAPSIDFNIAGVPYLRSSYWTANDQPNTFVVVGTFPYVQGEQSYIFAGMQSNAKHNLYRHPTTGMLLVRASSSTTATSATTDPADGLAHLIGAIVNGSSTSLILDDAVVPLTGNAGAERSIGIALGTSDTMDPNHPFRGRIAFVGVIDGIATEGQLADLWAWARDRYGL